MNTYTVYTSDWKGRSKKTQCKAASLLLACEYAKAKTGHSEVNMCWLDWS